MDHFRFLHAADIHLDSALQRLQRHEGAPGDEVFLACRRAMENLVKLAIDEQVAFVVIAGDLYDGTWKDFRTGLFFVAQMTHLREAKIPVFIIKGNHDAESKITSQLPLPDNVVMLDHRKPQTVRLENVDVAVHGQSFAQRDIFDDLSQGYPAADPGLFNLGVLHTCASGREDHDKYAPCTLEGLCSKGYDYWALGHIHKPEILSVDPHIIFPGNVQGRSIRETGERGCVLVDVNDGHVIGVETRALDVFRWERCWIDAAGASNSADLLDRIRQKLTDTLAEADDRSLAVRIELAGACAAHREIAAQPEYFASEVRSTALNVSHQIWIEKVVTATTLPIDLADAIAVDGPLGELARYIDELKADPDQIASVLGSSLAELRKKLPAESLRAPALEIGDNGAAAEPAAKAATGTSVAQSVALPASLLPNELLDQVQQMLVKELSSAAHRGERS